MPIDPFLFRRVMGQFVTGVTLVTTLLEDGKPWAMTANSFTSISLDPPIVMVAITRGLTTNNAVRSSRVFGVNILRADQIWIARRFASSNRPPDQFADIDMKIATTGAPILEECLAWLDCHVTDFVEQGDHTVFFGEVQELSLGSVGDPLLYYNSAYARLIPEMANFDEFIPRPSNKE